MDRSLSGCFVYGILQARILEWIAIPLLQGIFPTPAYGLTSRDVTTNGHTTGGGTGTNTFAGGTDGEGVRQPDTYQTIGDNVHFGPAGIGLLIMGFLVLGCKYLNSSVFMFPSKKTREEISFLSL